MATGLFGAGAAVKFGRGNSAVSAWTGQATNSVLNQAKPMAGKNDLRITRVDPYIVRFVKDAKGQLTGNFCLLCRVETADGIIGFGWSCGSLPPSFVRANAGFVLAPPTTPQAPPPTPGPPAAGSGVATSHVQGPMLGGAVLAASVVCIGAGWVATRRQRHGTRS